MGHNLHGLAADVPEADQLQLTLLIAGLGCRLNQPLRPATTQPSI